MPSSFRAGAWLAAALCCMAAAAPAQPPPIRIGSVSTLTGPGSSDAWRSAQVYFDAINAAGGIGGRRIEYVVMDDRSDPAAARQAGRRLAADPSVVALGGGSSVLECAVNHDHYARAGLLSLPGAGIDPACFASPDIAPVNAGPYVATANAMSFARDVLRQGRLCVVAPALPGMVGAYEAVLAAWARGREGPPASLETFAIEEPLPRVVERVLRRRCEAIVYGGPEGMAVQWVLQARPALPGVAHVFLTSAYTTTVLKAVGAAGEGIYAMAEFEPWSSRSLQLTDWRRLVTGQRIEPSSLSQGGYLAAQLLVQVLRGVRGPVTRASVTEALRAMAPVRNPLIDEPFVFGPGAAHQPNRSGLAMQLVSGRWRIAHHQWLRFEPR